jgi:hypothetical protein
MLLSVNRQIIIVGPRVVALSEFLLLSQSGSALFMLLLFTSCFVCLVFAAWFLLRRRASRLSSASFSHFSVLHRKVNKKMCFFPFVRSPAIDHSICPRCGDSKTVQ